MRLSILVLSLFSLSCSALAHAEANTKPETLEQRTSYTLGVDIAKNLSEQGLDIDIPAFSMGLNDALQGKTLALTADEMSDAIEQAKQKMLAKRQAERQAQAAENAQAGDQFRSEFAKQDKTLTTANGILYQVLQEGKGDSPSDDDSIYAHYEGTFINGEVFDSSYKRGRALKLQTSDVIKGWGEVLKMMKPGSKWKVVIPPELAYGKKGAGDVIGPNATLVFTIELISFGKEN
ncbi:peptidyl-prolyl cis-trans isomerase Mip [Thiosulfatimonas sediminis]|uniref:Peptidyl-prolyl cis-trans isomerase n=1 Tax=Thiosulfatimonas sediminis TaxID=2675054 RepID=A0A6F8PTV7_9GAMM|nr:FKBP-type peptidyl-prolyl cis-trans isomerase [Thiosulfatimonas sediminis]BBP45573.1 peptidyl-prolyl cis-trans isomerase Mip [Thiosulfatimonas sediminis]